MNPRYPTSSHLRRHRQEGPSLRLVWGTVTVLGLIGLMIWSPWRSIQFSSSAPIQDGKATATATSIMPEPKPLAKPRPVTGENQPRPGATQVADNREEGVSGNGVSRDVETSAVAGSAPAIKPTMRVMAGGPPTDVVADAAKIKSGDGSAAGTADVNLTFYQLLQDRHVVLPLEKSATVANGAHPPINGQSGKPASESKSMVATDRSAPTKATEIKPVVSRTMESHPMEARAVTTGWGSSPFAVHLNTYPSFREAAAQASRLQREGAPAQVVRIATGSGEGYQVHLGPFHSRDEASRFAGQWKGNGAAAVVQNSF